MRPQRTFLILFIAAAAQCLSNKAWSCTETPPPPTISASGAQADDQPNHYFVGIPQQGAINITITGSGDTPCPTDAEKCTCKDQKQSPSPNGSPKYTFSFSIGQQSPAEGPTIQWTVTSATAPGEYTFRVTNIEQKYSPCPPDWSGGIGSKSNSQPSEEVTIAAATAAISSVTPNDKILCNSADFYDSGSYSIGFVYVNINPFSVTNSLKQYVDLEIDGATPNTDDWGYIDNEDSYQQFGGPFEYHAKTETTNDKCESDPALEDQTITLGLYFNGEECDTETFTVRSVFKFLKENKLEFNSAIAFVNAKYGIGQSAAYDPALQDDGSTQALSGAVTIGGSAFSSENNVASTLIHEQVHVGQGSAQRIIATQGQIFWDNNGGEQTPAANYTSVQRDCISTWANSEIAAYYAEVAAASATCLSNFDMNYVTFGISYYTDIDYYITHP